MPKYDWEDCKCVFPFGELIICGCEKKHLRWYRDTIIHWLDQHWTFRCAFEYAIDLLEHGTKPNKSNP